MAGAVALAADHDIADPHADADARDIGAFLATLLGPFPYALGRHCLTVPTIEPEDTIGLGDHVPTLDIGESLAPLVPGPDMLGAQFR